MAAWAKPYTKRHGVVERERAPTPQPESKEAHMAKRFYIRVMRSGRYIKCARYRRAMPRDTGRTKAARMQHTRAAQRFINCKNSADRLTLLLYGNFDHHNACFVTQTYDNGHLPATREAAKRCMRKSLDKIRTEFVRRGRPFPYAYTTEGAPAVPLQGGEGFDAAPWETRPWAACDRWEALGDKDLMNVERDIRFHHHAIMLLDPQDYDTVRASWPYGNVYIEPIDVDSLDSFERLAYYMTKESRAGLLPNGDHAYVCGLGLVQPKITGRWVDEFEDIVIPKGATLITAQREENMYSSYHQCSFILPREKAPPQEYQSPYRQKKRKPAP